MFLHGRERTERKSATPPSIATTARSSWARTDPSTPSGADPRDSATQTPDPETRRLPAARDFRSGVEMPLGTLSWAPPACEGIHGTTAEPDPPPKRSRDQDRPRCRVSGLDCRPHGPDGASDGVRRRGSGQRFRCCGAPFSEKKGAFAVQEHIQEMIRNDPSNIT